MAGIHNEQLIPLETIPSASSNSPDFSSDLTHLAGLLKDNEAAYVILRRYPAASDGYVAVTYVPDSANVRQKMLFASTRLTLVRELGAERFRETIFVTSKDELTAEGFRKLDKHAELYVWLGPISVTLSYFLTVLGGMLIRCPEQQGTPDR